VSISGFILGGSRDALWTPSCSFGRSGCRPALNSEFQRAKLEVAKAGYEANAERLIFVCPLVFLGVADFKLHFPILLTAGVALGSHFRLRMGTFDNMWAPSVSLFRSQPDLEVFGGVLAVTICSDEGESRVVDVEGRG